MFCYQCEQAAGGVGCSEVSVCGKSEETAALQDLLTYALQGLSMVAIAARKHGIDIRDTGRFVCEGLFATLTNVNFDEGRFEEWLNECTARRHALENQLTEKGGAVPGAPEASFSPAGSLEDLIKQGRELHLFLREPNENEDIFSLKSLLIFGLRGVAAYAYHAATMGREDDTIYDFVMQALAASARDDIDMNEALGLVLECGEVNLRTMELLDAAHTETFGHPEPTTVPLGARKGKAILVSGHDLADLKALLEQTEGKGINIYTHGEMLPAHGYPELRKHEHFVGHFGGAWQDQVLEFPRFPGAILMTTNCLQRPKKSYFDNIFTCGTVGWPGVRHIEGRDFSPVIEKALEMDGYAEDNEKGTMMTGFGHNAVLGVADQVIGAVKSGQIRHFFLVGGCDGAAPGRNYFTEFVEQVPRDCLVLTLACGKFRFNTMDLGDIGGIPRLLDVGQCNDAYSAIKIATALADAFNCGVNDLPLSLVLSWYEQKAVAILLTLLHLGIRDIRLGPSLPAFVSPNVLRVLVDQFDLKPVDTPEADLKAILEPTAA